MDKTLLFFLSVIIAYFLGNISPSTLIGRAHGIDIKKEGSGNAGTTNTLRVLGVRAAAVTLVIDVGKGALAVFLGSVISGREAAMYCALAAFLGHIWPVLFRFRGGKGVAVAFGGILVLNWKMALISLALVIITVLITKKASCGSIAAAVTFPFECRLMEPDFFYIGLVMAALLIFTHRSNIVRLVRHEEDNIDFERFKKKRT